MVARAEMLASVPTVTRPASSTTHTWFQAIASGSDARFWEDSNGRVTAFCHGVGTGGSLMGVSEALKSRGVIIQAHEPAGSAALSGGEQGAFLIQGWTGFVVPHWGRGKG